MLRATYMWYVWYHDILVLLATTGAYVLATGTRISTAVVVRCTPIQVYVKRCTPLLHVQLYPTRTPSQVQTDQHPKINASLDDAYVPWYDILF